MKKMENEKGFTLIELMIALVIAGLLAAFGLNQYRRYVISAHKKAVQAKIMEIASTLERDYTNNGEYRVATVDSLNANVTTNQYSGNSGFARYTIQTTRLDSQRYTVRATPQDVQVEDACGWLQIDNFGIKAYETQKGGSSKKPVADISKCW